jgi:hypothetical protein
MKSFTAIKNRSKCSHPEIITHKFLVKSTLEKPTRGKLVREGLLLFSELRE